ncbi:FecR family protein [Flavihumibacter petaseus]|uniref:Putative anti-sigma factor n=1 Tax=Flavihumibacter petaseus NBRC 106054 TaxID=1220578 RepID=A0A0E9N4P3_9BACT|nr:FecR domain-containing protein [Flavihumibacter petaseus]GAO44768.1 putative anti-sigma factor [Flavihumibacter petaseus NBRC 106054]
MEERIQYLFLRYLQQTCTREEFEELFRLLDTKDADAAVNAVLQRAFTDIQSKSPSGTTVNAEGKLILNDLFPFPKEPSAVRRRLPGMVAIVSVLLILTTGWWWFHPQSTTKPEQQLSERSVVRNTSIRSTARSEYKYLLLPDSTQVWLNAASTLEYPQSFNGDRREVLLNGEAYFDVKHADSIPFVIYSGRVSTTVLGTAFNIKAYPGMRKVTVSVRRGKVKVQYDGQPVALLTKGQQVSIDNISHAAVEKNLKEETAAAWHEGNLIYDDYTVEDMIADLQRVYDVTILVESPAVQKMRVSTSFKREMGIDKALEIICRLTDCTLSTSGGTYILRQ